MQTQTSTQREPAREREREGARERGGEMHIRKISVMVYAWPRQRDIDMRMRKHTRIHARTHTLNREGRREGEI